MILGSRRWRALVLAAVEGVRVNRLTIGDQRVNPRDDRIYITASASCVVEWIERRTVPGIMISMAWWAGGLSLFSMSAGISEKRRVGARSDAGGTGEFLFFLIQETQV